MQVKLNLGWKKTSPCDKIYLQIYTQELFALLSAFYQLTLITAEL